MGRTAEKEYKKKQMEGTKGEEEKRKGRWEERLKNGNIRNGGKEK